MDKLNAALEAEQPRNKDPRRLQRIRDEYTRSVRSSIKGLGDAIQNLQQWRLNQLEAMSAVITDRPDAAAALQGDLLAIGCGPLEDLEDDPLAAIENTWFQLERDFAQAQLAMATLVAVAGRLSNPSISGVEMFDAITGVKS